MSAYLALTLSFLSPQVAHVPPELYAGMQWRLVGPMRGGRSLSVAGSASRPREFYFGATGGGVWKTIDAGARWRNVSDGFFGTSSVGAVAVAPSNPDVVVAGTGERDMRSDISLGDGVYRTVDAGKTWSKIGLGEGDTIAKIVIDPHNPDVFYVAALGHAFAHPGVADPGGRGLFKTTDGGKSWSCVLRGGPRAGIVDVVLDPHNSDVLLAAEWEAWRSPYHLNSGGPASRLFKSTDGGRSWIDITRRPGMPSGVIGKIGLTISPADSRRYWAIVEAADGGIYRSDDAGQTWTKTNDQADWRQRAWYFSHLTADPADRDTVYVLNTSVARSTDGGKTFKRIGNMHGDCHELWIAPNDPNRLALADDGGASVSTDGGKAWSPLTMPTAQIYHVTTDNAFPYRVLGAQQDNSSVRLRSKGVPNSFGESEPLDTAGGESGYIAAKPDDPDVVFGGGYGGDLQRRDHRTGESRMVNPWPDLPMGHGAIDLDQRFQWTFPIVFSPNDPNTLYACSQYVFRTTDGGQTWARISPDLTRNDPATLRTSGGPITQDNTSAEYYGTVFTIAESPVKRGVLWAGSDDGLIHVSRNGGRTWVDVTPPAMPKWAKVSMLEASPFSAGTAYAAIDNHANDDVTPYAYRTDDFGRTWRPIVDGLPKGAFVRVVREDRRQTGLLYAGTETGVWVSFNGGQDWQSLQLDLPRTPVHDLALKDDDLVAATHGRGFWILDDLAPLRAAAADPSLRARLFPTSDAHRVDWGYRGPDGPANPPNGVLLDYFLPKEAKSVKLSVLDATGNVVKSVDTPPKTAGFHRASLWLVQKSWSRVPGMVLWNTFPQGIASPPGVYTAQLSVDGLTERSNFRWMKDPRVAATDADIAAQSALAHQIAQSVGEANDAVQRIRHVRDGLAKVATDSKAAAGAQALDRDLEVVEEALWQRRSKSGEDPLNYPVRLNNKLATLMNLVLDGDNRPTAAQLAVYAFLSKQLDKQLSILKPLLGTRLDEVNSSLKASGSAPIKIAPIDHDKLAAPDLNDDEADEKRSRRD